MRVSLCSSHVCDMTLANILVVDDSPTMRKMVIAALDPMQARFGEAGDGLEAIEQLALGHYELLILDLSMPEMDGLEVLAFLRGSEPYRRLPVLVLTTCSDDETRESAVRAGANLFMIKPFQPAELMAAVEGLVTKA